MKYCYLNCSFPALLILFWLLPLSTYAQHEITSRSSLNTGTSTSWEQRSRVAAMLTVLRNKHDLLPVLEIEKRKMLLLSLGTNSETAFQASMSRYAHFPAMHIPYDADTNNIHKMTRAMAGKNLVIVSMHNIDKWEQLPEETRKMWHGFIQRLIRYEKAIFVLFGHASSLAFFPELSDNPSLILANQDMPVNQDLAGQLIFGAIEGKGRLVEDINQWYHKGNGLRTAGNYRFSYTMPEEVGWSSTTIHNAIDTLVNAAIQDTAFPGCQILVAKGGKVIFHKAYGHHTYEQKKEVELTDLYDLASITKISGSLAALMKLKDDAKIQLDVPFLVYWPDFAKSPKGMLTLREILAHQAGLIPYITFWKETQRRNGKFKGGTFSPDSSTRYPIRSYSNLYLHRKYRKKMFKAIRKSPLHPEQGYVYSGLSFLLYPQIVSQLTGQPFDEYLQENFYGPLGATRLTYNPWQKFSADQIVPTEMDSFFRKTIVQSYVHDENASMFGGVSGNAGLFATANDLAKLMQMYLNMGEYGGKRYISTETLKEFTSYQFKDEGNRRGLGFDKPMLENRKAGYVSPSASDKSFGHTGFTGTFTWADPEHDLLLVFLSNRVYPTRYNRNLYTSKFRQKLHQILYDQIEATQ